MKNTEMMKYLDAKVMLLDAALEAMKEEYRTRMSTEMDDEKRGAYIIACDELQKQMIAQYNAAVRERDEFARKLMPKVDSPFLFQ